MTLKKISSEITTLAKAIDISTGTEHTKTGAETMLTTEKKCQALDFLKKQLHSMETTQKLVSTITSITNLRPKILNRTITRPNGKPISIYSKVTIRANNSDELNSVDRAVQAVMLPLPKDEIEKKLILLSIKVTATNHNAEDLKLKIKLYASYLEEHPADIALHVIELVGNNEEWFPSWSKFEKELWWRTANRKCFVDAVNTERIRIRNLQ